MSDALEFDLSNIILLENLQNNFNRFFSMFVSGFLGFFLDNTIPGTDEERGITLWTSQLKGDSEQESENTSSCYDIPFITKYLKTLPSLSWTKYLPFSPTFKGFSIRNKIFPGTTKSA